MSRSLSELAREAIELPQQQRLTCDHQDTTGQISERFLTTSPLSFEVKIFGSWPLPLSVAGPGTASTETSHPDLGLGQGGL